MFKQFLQARPEVLLKSPEENRLEREEGIRLIREEMSQLQLKIALKMNRRDAEQTS